MKTRIAIILLGLAALASCSKETGVVPSPEGIITLGVASGSNGKLTRSPVNSLTDLVADGTNVGVYGVATANTDASTSTAGDWTAAPLMNHIVTTSVNAAGILNWDNPESYYYPTDAEAKQNVRFFAYYPVSAATLATVPGAGMSPKLTFGLSGVEDVMWAAPGIGSRTQPASRLMLKHRLTQFTFVLKDTDESFMTSNGSVAGISIKANTQATLDMESGVLSNWGTEKSLDICGSVTLTGKEPLPLDKVLMLEAGKTSYKVTVNTSTGKSLSADIKPVVDSEFEAGRHYVITLNLSGNVLIEAGVGVEDWVEGNIGNGVVA